MRRITKVRNFFLRSTESKNSISINPDYKLPNVSELAANRCEKANNTRHRFVILITDI